MRTVHDKDCMMLSIAEEPHCTCGMDTENLRDELASAEKIRNGLELQKATLVTQNAKLLNSLNGFTEDKKILVKAIKSLTRLTELDGRFQCDSGGAGCNGECDKCVVKMAYLRGKKAVYDAE